MINRRLAIRKNVAGFLVVAGWLSGFQLASAQESGKQIFQKSCAACHSIGGGRLVGPDLAGVTDRRPEDWLLKFTKSSQTLVKSGDKTAMALFEEFNKIPMPDQALSDEQIKKVLAHIKEAGGSLAAGKETATPSAPATASVTEAQPDEIQLGQDLFEGKVRFGNGGPSCNACHHVRSDALLGGGVMAAELSLVFSRLGREGVRAIIGASPFPVMQAAYAGKGFSDKEISALVGFLQHVDKEHARQMPKEWGWRMFSAGFGGVIVLAGIFSLAGRRRKSGPVNRDIYERQIRSE
jgi:mono/diheme cytochrome c family protein